MLGSPRETDMSFYHHGQRSIQARFASTALADRLEQVTHRTALTPDDAAFVTSASFFFLATADANGHPDCSYKGGAPGFVRVASPELLVFPDYDGNGMFRSLGNIEVNPSVGLLFIALDATAKKLRINGRAELRFDDPMISDFSGAQALVKVTPVHVFPNCPRYVHDLGAKTMSPYTPQPDETPLEPAWKGFDAYKDVVPRRKA
jgi:predicted pyridoxine 5'-phosphate oxidase superfamily flavin-nucleotide-binding protein